MTLPGPRAEPAVVSAMATAVVVATALLVVVVGFRFGAPVAGGSDSYGYVSQAHLWAAGRMRGDLDSVAELVPLVRPTRALVPLGWKLAADRASMAPIYSPGLPVVMAVFERIGGSRAVFWVVPLLGGLAVLATSLLARRAGGALAGALAAVLLASSPVFLIQLCVAPMSDLPAAAWWTLALALVLTPGRPAGLAAGATAGLAVLTRPNLVTVALVPAALLLGRALGARRAADGAAPGAPQPRPAPRPWSRLLAFCGPVVAASVAVAVINTLNYGSPSRTGYPLRELFALGHLRPNLARYPELLTLLETPAVWLAALAPLLVARAGRPRSGPGGGSGVGESGAPGGSWRDPSGVTGLAAGTAVVVFASYLYYPSFDSQHTLRFLLPALPAVFVLLALALDALARLLPPSWLRMALPIAVAAGIALHGIDRALAMEAFDTRGEIRYPLLAREVVARLPERAVLISMQHSGSLRYYARRPTVRFDLLPRGRLDQQLQGLRSAGFAPYFVLERWEVAMFRERFQGRSRFGALDWPPLFVLDRVGVAVWDPSDQGRGGAARERVTEHVPWPYSEE